MYEMGEEELEALKRVIESRELFRYRGGECSLFESEFTAHLGGSRRSLLVSSGTNALIAALRAVGAGEGDEVLVPAYTYVATAAAVRLVGATPVIVGIDSELGMDVEEARALCGPSTRAIIPVHMDGLSAVMAPLLDLAHEKGLAVVEDCAQAIGGSYHGRKLGTLGEAAAFSLNESKIISCGEGGIAVCERGESFERAFNASDLAARFSPAVKQEFSTEHLQLGYSMRVSEIQGAIMRVQLRRLEGLLGKLRSRKAILLKQLRGFDFVTGGCREGDCGVALHPRFSDPAAAASACKRLNVAGISAVLPAMRPAHAAWKWQASVGIELAPLEIFTSMERLACVVRIDVDPSMNDEVAHSLGEKIRSLL